jgi:hypothetical protein
MLTALAGSFMDSVKDDVLLNIIDSSREDKLGHGRPEKAMVAIFINTRNQH